MPNPANPIANTNAVTFLPRIRKRWRHMGHRAILTVTGIILALSACTPTDDHNLLVANCQPPCWYWIMPGKTTTDEALALIPQIPGVHDGTVVIRDLGDGNDYIRWLMRSGTGKHDYFGELTTSVGIVSGLSLTPDGDVTLKDVFLAYGEPDTVGGFYWEGRGHSRRVFLLFDEGMAIALGDDGWLKSTTWRLRPNDQVRYLYFFEPNTLHGLVGNNPMFLTIAPSLDALTEASRPWDGYSTLALTSTDW